MRRWFGRGFGRGFGWGVGWGLVAAAVSTPGWAQDEVLQAEVSLRRGVRVVGCEVDAPGGSVQGARLRRGEAVQAAQAVEQGERVRVEWVSARVLLPGRYEVEVLGAGGEVLARRGLQVGSVAEGEAAEARVRTWWVNATRTLRGLSAALERRGAYHRALALGESEGVEDQRRRFFEFLEGWRVDLRVARMDLATFQRRAALPPLGELVSEVVGVCGALEARARVWSEAVEAAARGEDRAPPPLALGPVRAVLERLGSAPEGAVHWEGGPLAAPPLSLVETLDDDGVFHSPLGVRLEVPDGFHAEVARTNPQERLRLVGDGVTVVLTFQVFPDVEEADALCDALEVGAWETWRSYKRLGSERLEAGLRWEFLAELDDARRVDDPEVHVVQRSIFASGGRVASLVIARAAGTELPGGVETLESSFMWEAP